MLNNNQLSTGDPLNNIRVVCKVTSTQSDFLMKCVKLYKEKEGGNLVRINEVIGFESSV